MTSRLAWCVIGMVALALPALGQYPAADVLTEYSAGQWDTGTASGSASVSDDTSRVYEGAASLRFDTDSGFDTWLWSPVTRDANWDLSTAARLRFWVYAENPSPYDFQNNSPWIKLGTGLPSAGDYYQYQTNTNILNTAIGQWVQFDIPLTGGSPWQRFKVGNPDLGDIDWIEIHADTWDHGFTVWYDGMEFVENAGELPPPTGLALTPYYSTAHVEWDAHPDPNVAGYEVFRRTAGGSYGSPLKVVLGTSFTDYGLTPGETYYYQLRAIEGSGLALSEFTPELDVTLDTDPTSYSVHKNFELLMVVYTGGYSTAEVDAMVEGLKLGLEFYWRSSVGQINMDVTWLFIDTYPPGSDWYSNSLQNDLRSRGMQDDQFDLAYLVGQDLAGCFGGYVVFGSTCASLGTICGVPYPANDPGVNYTIPWTFTHEIHHALEAMENRTSGTPEVLFCHFPWCYPDPLGPSGWQMDWGAHYDGIAATNREYGDQWFLYPAPYDGYIECIDLDMDGLPDDDPRVWMDEARFGSSALMADTDGDGLDDLGEYSAYNFRGTSPVDRDTDGDGLDDGLDHQPLYRIDRSIARFTAAPVIDGLLDADWTLLTDEYYYTKNSTPFALNTYAGYDEDNLYLAFESTQHLRFMISLDGSGEDGRFESPVRHTSGATDTNNSNNKGNHIGDSWGDGHHLYAVAGSPTLEVWGRGTVTGAEVYTRYSGGRFLTEIRIPRVLPGGAAYTWYPSDAPVVDGLTLAPGELIGLNVTASNYSGSDGNEFSGTWTGLFETHAYVDFTLQLTGDVDLDTDYDLRDFAGLQGCGGGAIPGACELVDLSGDDVIDVADLELFADAMTGPLP